MLDVSLLNDPFKIADLIFNNKFEDRIANIGLRGMLSNPHNLYAIKGKNGDIEAWKMELVYTPFKKTDLAVRVQDNILYVEIGKENKPKSDDMIYQGISYQSTRFQIRLSPIVDTEKITAVTDEGILTITLPVKAKTQSEPKAISVL